MRFEPGSSHNAVRHVTARPLRHFMCTLPTLHASPCSRCSQPQRMTPMPDRHGGQRRRWSSGQPRRRRRRPNDHLRCPGGIRNFKGHCERRLSHEIEAVTAVYWGHFRWQMTVVEIIIAELHFVQRRAPC